MAYLSIVTYRLSKTDKQAMLDLQVKFWNLKEVLENQKF